MIRPQLVMDLNAELIVDNFAGGGGASSGIELALGRCVDVAINHDREAVEMHAANHPQTRHFCEDVWSVDPRKATGGRPVGLAWFSPDCKHFSKAKGGKPRDKKIRGLCWVILRWMALVKPRVVMMENVEEFQTMGPLDAAGMPCKQRRGKDYRSFLHQIRGHGYEVEARELRACDYGAPTIRKRLFIIARCDGRPIVWPEPTHGAPGSEGVRSGRLKPWRTAAECIDWSIPCPSIFERKRPLAEATMRRIARGIFRYVINAANPFIVRPGHADYGPNGSKGWGVRVHPIDEPIGTVLASNEFAIAAPYVTEHANGSKQRNMAANEPLRTQCAEVKGGHFAMVAPTLVQTGYGEREGQAPRALDIEKPLGTVVGGGQKHALASAFLAKHYGGNETPGASAEKPMDTITATDHHAPVVAHLVRHFGESVGSSPDEPAGTVMPGGLGKTGVMAAQLVGAGGPAYSGKPKPVDEPFTTLTAENHRALVVSHLNGCGGRAGQSRPRGVDEPAATLTSKADGCLVTSHLAVNTTGHPGAPANEPLRTICAGGTHHSEVRALLIKYYGEGGQHQSCREPMHTIPTKDRIGLVTVAGEEYMIADIGMRMLEPHELYAAQGFPVGYIIAPEVNGRRLPKHAQVRMCGNSVCPPLARALAAVNVPDLAAWQPGEQQDA